MNKSPPNGLTSLAMATGLVFAAYALAAGAAAADHLTGAHQGHEGVPAQVMFTGRSTTDMNRFTGPAWKDPHTFHTAQAEHRMGPSTVTLDQPWKWDPNQIHGHHLNLYRPDMEMRH